MHRSNATYLVKAFDAFSIAASNSDAAEIRSGSSDRADDADDADNDVKVATLESQEPVLEAAPFSYVQVGLPSCHRECAENISENFQWEMFGKSTHAYRSHQTKSQIQELHLRLLGILVHLVFVSSSSELLTFL